MKLSRTKVLECYNCGSVYVPSSFCYYFTYSLEYNRAQREGWSYELTVVCPYYWHYFEKIFMTDFVNWFSRAPERIMKQLLTNFSLSYLRSIRLWNNTSSIMFLLGDGSIEPIVRKSALSIFQKYHLE